MAIQILNLSKVYKLIVENKDENESIDDFNNILIDDIINASNLSIDEFYDLVVNINVSHLINNIHIWNIINFYNFNTMDQIRSAYIREIYINYDYKIPNIDELCEDLITYLTEKTCINKTYKCRTYTCDDASKNGHLDCLKYAHENCCALILLRDASSLASPWTSYACDAASENGHLDCLKYAHENGCDWTEHTCSNASLNGHLDCLKYAHENCCPWSKITCSNASKNSHLDCLKYAFEHVCSVQGQPFS
jgi:hypothetical protein